MGDYGEERDVGENTPHPVIRGKRVRKPPDDEPPLSAVQNTMDSEAMMWALSLSPGFPSQHRPTNFAKTLTERYEAAAGPISGPNVFCNMKVIKDFVLTPMHGADVVFLHGCHGSGKTTLIPVIAETLAYERRCIMAGKPASELEMSRDSEGCSKYLIVVENANTAATLRRHLKKVYPSLPINCYFDIADSSIEDHMECIEVNGRKVDKNTPIASTAMLEVYAVIAPPHAAVEMIKNGFIGTVFLENAELYHRIAGFTEVICAALTSMQSDAERKLLVHVPQRRLGRLVILTADEKLDKWMTRLKDVITAQTYKVMTVRMGGTEIVSDVCTLFDHRDPSLFPSIADLRCSDKARAIMDAALVAPAAAITRKTAGKWATGINEFYRFEHKMKDDASDKAFENVTPLEPNHPFIRHEIEAVVKAVLTAQVNESLDANFIGIRKVKNILIAATSPEQVSAIGTTLLGAGMEGAFKVLDTGDSAYFTSRISYKWRFDSELFRSMFDSRRDKRIRTQLAAIGPIKGRVVIATVDVAVALEIPNLAAVIVAGSHRRPHPYKPNGLEEAVNADIDGHTLRLLRSRLGRDGTPGTMYFAGTALLLSQLWQTDNRAGDCGHAEDMVNVLREICAIPQHRVNHLVAQQVNDIKILPNARICGYIHDAPQFVRTPQSDTQAAGGYASTRVELHPPFARLVTLFPYLQPSTAAMLVMGVRCGVGRAAMALAALEAISDRIIQQVPTTMSAGMRGADVPFLDMFQFAVMSGYGHSSNGPIPPMGGYPSEATAIADALSSLIDAFDWKQTDKDLECYVAKTIAVALWNFWCGIWSGPGKGWENKIDKVKTRMIRPVTFSRLYDENIKDEGRQAFFAIIRKINKTLRKAAIVPFNANCASDIAFNNPKYALNRESPLLNGEGLALLSGIITMSSMRFANFINDKRLGDEEASLLSPRYRVHERVTEYDHMLNPKKHVSAIVTGYTIWSPSATITTKSGAWAAYERTTARSSAKGGNFHSRMHPVKIGQIAAIGNIFTEGCHFVRGGKSKDSAVTMHLPVLAHTHPHQEMLFTMDEEEAAAIENGRDYLRGILYAALDKNYPMDSFEEFIIASWKDHYN